MILKFQLTKFEKVLAFQVIEQNEKFKNLDPTQKMEFMVSTGLNIVSDKLTRLLYDNKELHLLGSFEAPYETPTTSFESNDIRDEFYEYTLDSIEKFANECELFEEEREGCFLFLKKEGDIYSI